MSDLNNEKLTVIAGSKSKNFLESMFRSFWRAQERERGRLHNEILKVNGLMAILMKPRNGLRWTAADRRQIIVHLRHLRNLGFYITFLIAPGGFVMLPIFAWWLDRRKINRENKQQENSKK